MKRKIENYTYNENDKLRAGSYGSVYVAYDTNGIPYAIKKIDIGREMPEHREKMIKCIEREIELLEKIHNDNIIELHDWIMTKENNEIVYYLIYELADEVDLEKKLKALLLKKSFFINVAAR